MGRKERLIKQRLWLNEKIYQFNLKHKTKCPCFICKKVMKFIDILFRFGMFCDWICNLHWEIVEYRGSNYADFREYEVIDRRKVRFPDGKGLKWPKTDYKHIRATNG